MSAHLESSEQPEGTPHFCDPAPKSAKARGWSVVSRILRLAVVGVLAFWAFDYGLQATDRVRHQALLLGCEQNLLELSQTLETYAEDHQGEYPGKWEDLFPEYLTRLPRCPAAEQPTYNLYTGLWAPFNDQEQPSYYYLTCFGNHHQGYGLSWELPGYSKTNRIVRQYPK